MQLTMDNSIDGLTSIKIMDIMVLLIKRDRLERRTLRCATQG